MGTPFKVLFPAAFSMSVDKEATVHHIGYFEGNNWVWQLGFNLAVLTSEASNQVCDLEMILHDIGPVAGASDCFKWFKCDNGFSVCSATSGYVNAVGFVRSFQD